MQAASIKLGKLNYSSGYSLNWSVSLCFLYLYFKNDAQSILCHSEKAYIEKKSFLRNKIQKITPPILK